MTENVKNLFSFIDFLHSNKDYFLSKKPFLDEVKLLREEEQKLDLKNNPEDILKSREINSAIDKIIDPVFYEIRELIETNVLKFNISNDFDVKKGININAYSDLAKLENTFESNDIEVIKTALNRYYDFKTSSFKIVSGFFDMTSNYLFDHLDEIFSGTLGVFGAKAIKKEESIPEPQLIANQKSESIPAPQQEQPIKFTAKEYALAYIFDLYANGRQIPINRIEGSLSKKEIEQYGKDNIQFIKPNTFYSAVKDLNKNYNVSIIKDLQNISQDWLNAVKSLAKDWKKTKAYLTAKELYRE